VTLDVFTADGKPKFGAGMFGSEERVENLLKKNFFGMPPPVSSNRTVFIFYF
jgi:hypothetical protein